MGSFYMQLQVCEYFAEFIKLNEKKSVIFLDGNGKAWVLINLKLKVHRSTGIVK